MATLFYEAAAGSGERAHHHRRRDVADRDRHRYRRHRAGQGCEADPVNPQRVTCGGDPRPVDKIVVNVKNLDDTVTLSTSRFRRSWRPRRRRHAQRRRRQRHAQGRRRQRHPERQRGQRRPHGEARRRPADRRRRSGHRQLRDVERRDGRSRTTTGPQDTGAGMDSLSAIENVNGSTTGADILMGDAAPNTFIGSGGDDLFHVDGGGSDVVMLRWRRQTRSSLDRIGHPALSLRLLRRHHLRDGGRRPPDTTITAIRPGPTRPRPTTRAGSSRRTSPGRTSNARVVDTPEDVCSPARRHGAPAAPATRIPPPTDGSKVFAVRAVDDQTNDDPAPDSRAFTLDAAAPNTEIDSGPVRRRRTRPRRPSSSSPPRDSNASLPLPLRPRGASSCAPNPFTPDPAQRWRAHPGSRGDRRGREFDQTPASVSFRVDTGTPGPGPGDGPAPNPQPTRPSSRPRSSSARWC